MPSVVDRLQLLANVARFYRAAFQSDKTARKLATTFGLTDAEALERFQVGYSSGSLLRAVPSRGGVRDALKEMGLLTAEGKETTKGCLMLPALDQQENVLGFIAIDKDGRETPYPASLARIYANLRALAEREVIFTDAALKALLLAQAGQTNAVPVGKELAEEERTLIERHRPDKAFVVGELPELLKLLQRLEVPCFRLKVQLPAKPQDVALALKEAEPMATMLGPDATARVGDDCVRFECGGRHYELKELAPDELDRLRVRLRAEAQDVFHVDSLDLYAGRSRASFARSAAPLFGVSQKAVEGDLCLMIRKLESMRQTRRLEAQGLESRYVMTPDEEAEALEVLKRPDILDGVLNDLEALGYVGEPTNKKLGYLITISRKLESPLSGVIISRAGAGKSRLMEVLAELVPPEELESFTRITPQALYYAGDRNLAHKLMISGEDEGLLGSDYAIRELISSKRIRLATPVKDSATGRMRTVEYEVQGPIALLFSTTQPAIHHENATRAFVLSLDESADQTREVHRAQREGRTLEALARSAEVQDIKRRQRNMQRLLKPLAVVNPYAPYLSFPTQPLEMRREQDKYLSLIEAIALLYQHQRERKRCMVNGREVEYIEVVIEDIEQANALMTELLGTQAGELSRPSRELLKLIREMVEKRCQQLEIAPMAFRFNRRDIREYTGWSDSQIKAHIKQLEDLEYLLVAKGERGRMYRYELTYEGAHKDRKRLPGLTDTAKLKALGQGTPGMVRKSGMGGHGLVAEVGPVYAGKTCKSDIESLKVGHFPGRAYSPEQNEVVTRG